MVRKTCHNKLPSEMDVASFPLISLESWHAFPLVRHPGTSVWHSARVQRWWAASMPWTKERCAGSHCSPPRQDRPHLRGKTEWLEVRREKGRAAVRDLGRRQTGSVLCGMTVKPGAFPKDHEPLHSASGARHSSEAKLCAPRLQHH